MQRHYQEGRRATHSAPEVAAGNAVLHGQAVLTVGDGSPVGHRKDTRGRREDRKKLFAKYASAAEFIRIPHNRCHNPPTLRRHPPQARAVRPRAQCWSRTRSLAAPRLAAIHGAVVLCRTLMLGLQRPPACSIRRSQNRRSRRSVSSVRRVVCAASSMRPYRRRLVQDSLEHADQAGTYARRLRGHGLGDCGSAHVVPPRPRCRGCRQAVSAALVPAKLGSAQHHHAATDVPASRLLSHPRGAAPTPLIAAPGTS